MTAEAPPRTEIDSGLAPDFLRLWFARAASDAGTAIATGALPLIAIRVLEASTFQVSLLTAAADLVGAAFALPLGPALEARRKRPVMIAADLAHALAFLSIPLAHALGLLTFWHLVGVAAVAALGGIVFGGASAAHLKNLVPRDQRTAAMSRLESTFWLVNSLGPMLGGAVMQLLGATVTLLLQAAGMIASALGIRRIRVPEPEPPARHFLAEASAGFTVIAAQRTLRPLFLNSALSPASSPGSVRWSWCCCCVGSSCRPGSSASRSPCPASAGC